VSQPYQDQTGFGPPTGQPPFAPPPQKKSWWVWLLGGCGCSVVLLLLCCGGLTYFGVSKGMGALGELVKAEVADDEDVQENLGELTSVSMNIMETANEQKARGGESNLIVFDAKGTKGNGQFIVETPKGGQGQGGPFSSIELKLPDGTLKKIK
jgi:hypothetical protein